MNLPSNSGKDQTTTFNFRKIACTTKAQNLMATNSYGFTVVVEYKRECSNIALLLI